MQGVVVIGAGADEWERIRVHAIPGATARYDVGDLRHVLEFSGGYIALNLEPELASEYEAGELSVLPFPRPIFIVAEYTSPGVLRRAVLDGLFGSEVWIDDDNHPPMPISGFRERLREHPEWDWRRRE